MIHLQFPPIHKFLEKDTSSYEDNDPRKGVMVIEDHAVVMNKRSVVCFNLHDFFTLKEKKQTQEQIQHLNDILKFMNNKLFSSAFWDELTKGNVISIDSKNADGKMHLEGAVKKDLIHDYKKFDLSPLLQILQKNITKQNIAVDNTSFYVNPISDLLSHFKKYVKGDTITLEHIGINTTIRFTFQDNPWIYGLIDSDNALNNKNFKFEHFSTFYSEIVDNNG